MDVDSIMNEFVGANERRRRTFGTAKIVAGRKQWHVWQRPRIRFQPEPEMSAGRADLGRVGWSGNCRVGNLAGRFASHSRPKKN